MELRWAELLHNANRSAKAIDHVREAYNLVYVLALLLFDLIHHCYTILILTGQSVMLIVGKTWEDKLSEWRQYLGNVEA